MLEFAAQEIGQKIIESNLARLAKEIPNLNTNLADLDKSMVKELAESKKIEGKENGISELSYVGGGSYKDVRDSVKKNGLENKEVHHMPADSISDLSTPEGPAIEMDKEDHRLTASFGFSKEAQEYRAYQKESIEKGNFKEAMQMDIKDIQQNFGDKYDAHIEQMLKYVDKLEKEGKIK